MPVHSRASPECSALETRNSGVVAVEETFFINGALGMTSQSVGKALPILRRNTDLSVAGTSRSHEVKAGLSLICNSRPTVPSSPPPLPVGLIHANLSCHRVLARCRVLLPAPLRSPRFPHIDISCAEQGPGLVVPSVRRLGPLLCISTRYVPPNLGCRRRTGDLTGLAVWATLGHFWVHLKYLSPAVLRTAQTLYPPLDHSIIPRHPKPQPDRTSSLPQVCPFV